MILLANNSNAKKAAAIIKRGGLIIFPTETLYGLGCDATNSKTIKKIYLAKNRPKSKSFPILIRDFKMLSQYAFFDEQQQKIITSAKKPTNFILRAKNLPSSAMHKGTAAFRISSHPWIKNLFRYLTKPLIATSANISGKKPLSDSRQYKEAFEKKSKLITAVVFAGVNKKTKGSKIVDLTQTPFATIRY
ncbi:MAG: L-threonylcarbamoyladenylate synthase [Patescibacteria group bacterium]